MSLVEVYVCEIHWRLTAAPHWHRSESLGSFLTVESANAAYQAFDTSTVIDDDDAYTFSKVITPMLVVKTSHPTKDEDVYLFVDDLVIQPK
jgi:hypothetical protein